MSPRTRACGTRRDARVTEKSGVRLSRSLWYTFTESLFSCNISPHSLTLRQLGALGSRGSLARRVRPEDRQPRRVEGAPRPHAATHARPTAPRDRPAARRAHGRVQPRPRRPPGAPTPPAAHGARPSLVRADDRSWPKSVHCTHSSRVHARHDRRRTSRYWWVMSARPEPPFWFLVCRRIDPPIT